MNSLAEELAESAAKNISSNPQAYISLILHNGRLESMNRLYRAFSGIMNNNSPKFLLEKLDKHYSKDKILKEKEENPNKIFIFYDLDSEIYRRDKDISSRSFAIDIDACIKLFKKEI